MQSPATGGCLAAEERGCVCEKCITVGRRGACGWMKTFGLIGMFDGVGVDVSGGVCVRVGVSM